MCRRDTRGRPSCIARTRTLQGLHIAIHKVLTEFLERHGAADKAIFLELLATRPEHRQSVEAAAAVRGIPRRRHNNRGQIHGAPFPGKCSKVTRCAEPLKLDPAVTVEGANN
jgi:hypothetical protein